MRAISLPIVTRAELRHPDRDLVEEMLYDSAPR
jgi:hypothetical protein